MGHDDHDHHHHGPDHDHDRDRDHDHALDYDLDRAHDRDRDRDRDGSTGCDTVCRHCQRWQLIDLGQCDLPLTRSGAGGGPAMSAHPFGTAHPSNVRPTNSAASGLPGNDVKERVRIPRLLARLEGGAPG